MIDRKNRYGRTAARIHDADGLARRPSSATIDIHAHIVVPQAAKLAQPNIEVMPQDRAGFEQGLVLYRARLDKGYSLTDCVSMNTMRACGITECLTHDHHFEQEGFTILL